MARIRDAFVDTTNLVCPITYLKAKMALEKLAKGQILEVKLQEGKPLLTASRNFKEDGQNILEAVKNEDDTYSLFVEKVVSIGDKEGGY
ncbi:sulfurtransferase TusA family protein [Desulfitobacterium sp.]|uniref:sulfurtransferase TusA family protein n=1 Tax=Desulfitobacterium sp. TaxID=49981 RepID=UPI002C97DF14|nr:sulfurtransferase TusA family protein [Desulfitobacterium sp.]HVJ48013.1 sulfurtransferase TusA family protein [Desulfitobacterium sp.]